MSNASTPSKKPDTAIFVDVQNIYYTTQHAFRRKFDYRKLWARLTAECNIVIANAYAIHRGDAQQLKFQNALKAIGFTVKLKPFIQRSDGSAKGDWDVGITIDVLDAVSALDQVVLLSGDGDFDLLLEHIKRKHGTNTVVFGVPPLTSDSLIDSANQFRAIDETLLI